MTVEQRTPPESGSLRHRREVLSHRLRDAIYNLEIAAQVARELYAAANALGGVHPGTVISTQIDEAMTHAKEARRRMNL